jgi:cyclopropane fatty-acyl-phospholipid synthase-like methyltransferase
MAWFKEWFNTSYYHLLYGDRNEQEAADFIHALAQRLQINPMHSVIDLACGKGRHAITLNSHGCSVLGLDLSKESIAHAQQFATNTLAFKVHDMRMAYPGLEVDFLMNLFTSFGYFEDQADNLNTLKAVHKMLKPNGVFVQDYLNAHKVKSQIIPQQTVVKQGICFEIQKTINNNRVFKTIQFEDNQSSYCFTEQVDLLDLQAFEQLYQAAGLSITNVYGDYQLSPYSPENSERLILFSKKM